MPVRPQEQEQRPPCSAMISCSCPEVKLHQIARSSSKRHSTKKSIDTFLLSCMRSNDTVSKIALSFGGVRPSRIANCLSSACMHDKVLSPLLEHKGKPTGRKSAELDRLDFGLSSHTILEKIHLASAVGFQNRNHRIQRRRRP